jgi:outer membrane protein
MRRGVVFAAALAALHCVRAGTLPAQQPITLREAIVIAQQRSHQARAARASRDAARFRDDAFGSRLLPQLSLVGTVPDYTRSIIPVDQPDGGTLFRPRQQTNTTLSARLSQRLPLTGGDLFVTSALARLRLSGTQSVETWSTTPFAIGIRQDILRPNNPGWDRREQSVRTGRDERAWLEAMEDVALQTTDLFFGVYAAGAALRNAESNAAVNDTLYRINTGRFEVGRIGENDLLQSELALLRARTTLEGARLEHERALAALRLGLNMPPGFPLEIAVTGDVPEYAADSALAGRQALLNRAAVLDAELQEVQARRRVTDARLAGGMGATVQATFGYNATAPGMSLAYQDLREARQFSLSVQMPLWQWGARGETVRAAEADRERVAALSQSALENLAHEARFAALQLVQARRNVALLAAADTVAGRRFEVAYNRYVIGRISVDNLYIAQGEKDQALTQYVDGLRRFWQAHYRLRRVTLYDFEAGRPIR